MVQTRGWPAVGMADDADAAAWPSMQLWRGPLPVVMVALIAAISTCLREWVQRRVGLRTPSRVERCLARAACLLSCGACGSRERLRGSRRTMMGGRSSMSFPSGAVEWTAPSSVPEGRRHRPARIAVPGAESRRSISHSRQHGGHRSDLPPQRRSPHRSVGHDSNNAVYGGGRTPVSVERPPPRYSGATTSGKSAVTVETSSVVDPN